MAYEVFISYSHRDQVLRTELDKHLANLKRQNIIASWYDEHISPGTEWEPQVMEHLKRAQIILLLVIAVFMTSDFCYSIEMTQPLARYDAGGRGSGVHLECPLYTQSILHGPRGDAHLLLGISFREQESESSSWMVSEVVRGSGNLRGV